MAYAKGQLVRCTVVVRSSSTSSPVDAPTLTFKAKAPSGALTTYTLPASQIVHEDTGTYHVDVNANETGLWTYRFEIPSGQTFQSSGERTFNVDTSAF